MELMKRLAKILIAAAVLSVFMPMAGVQAKQDITKENFDYVWYLEQHPDLAAMVSADDHDTIWNFYETVGAPNGWNGRCTKESHMSRWDFDYATFLAMNPDVYAAFGDDYDRIYDWYMTMGIGENRPGAFSEDTIAVMKIYDIADSITNAGMSEREKVKAVHDWLCENVDYDYANYLEGKIPRLSYSIAGAVNHGKAVCNGYMLAFEAFMDVLGIECENVVGWSANSGHGWNRVKVDGNWYEIDVTWDDLGLYGKGYRHDYFLISEEQMNSDHGIYVRS